MDIYDKGYLAHLFLYVFCGLLDSMWQTTAYWMMGAMSNDPAKLAYFAGFCESFHWQLYPNLYTDQPIPLIQINQYSRLAPRAFGVLMP
jgi:hypothetical protein